MEEQIKQEAERIIDLFHIEIIDFNITDEVLENTAKQCALICVDEKIKDLKQVKKDYGIGLPIYGFLEEVKQYIEDNY